MRGKLVGAALGMLLLSSALASAQSTSCVQMGAFLNCNTPQPLPALPAIQPYAPTNQFNLGRSLMYNQQLRAGQAAEGAQAAQDAARAAQDARTVHAAKLVSDGHCDEAKSFAVSAGDIGLAQQVQSYCDSVKH